MKKSIVLTAVYFVVAMSFFACGRGGGESSPAAFLINISITPINPSIAKGTTNQFTATGTYSDGTSQDISASATWSSSNTGVATVNTSGLTTGVEAGTTTITATSGTISGSTPLLVTAATLSSIAVTPANPFIASGTTQQFTAMGIYSDSTRLDFTTAVIWSSSNTSVATISNATGSYGALVSASTGTATISAAFGGVSGSTLLTVLIKTHVPDTGQTIKYSAIFGEDADYTIFPPSYTDNGDGTISDNITGLMWQKQDDGIGRDWNHAPGICNDLNLGGFTDWRMPTIYELTTILDYGETPAINMAYFPTVSCVAAGNCSYWTTDPRLGGTGAPHYLVNFYDGAAEYVGYFYDSSYVRCVR